MRMPFPQLPENKVFNLPVSKPSMASISARYKVMKNTGRTLAYLCSTVNVLNMPVSQKKINF